MWRDIIRWKSKGIFPGKVGRLKIGQKVIKINWDKLKEGKEMKITAPLPGVMVVILIL